MFYRGFSPLTIIFMLLALVLCWPAIKNHFAIKAAKAEISALQLKNNKCALEAGIRTKEIADLTDGLAEQREAIDRITARHSRTAERLAEAEEAARLIKQRERAAVARLEAQQGSSCADGIDLIDKELRL